MGVKFRYRMVSLLVSRYRGTGIRTEILLSENQRKGSTWRKVERVKEVGYEVVDGVCEEWDVEWLMGYGWCSGTFLIRKHKSLRLYTYSKKGTSLKSIRRLGRGFG